MKKNNIKGSIVVLQKPINKNMIQDISSKTHLDFSDGLNCCLQEGEGLEM